MSGILNKIHSEHYLRTWTKQKLAERVRTLEVDYNALVKLYNRCVRINEQLLKTLQDVAPEAAKRLMKEIGEVK